MQKSVEVYIIVILVLFVKTAAPNATAKQGQQQRGHAYFLSTSRNSHIYEINHLKEYARSAFGASGDSVAANSEDQRNIDTGRSFMGKLTKFKNMLQPPQQPISNVIVVAAPQYVTTTTTTPTSTTIITPTNAATTPITATITTPTSATLTTPTRSTIIIPIKQSETMPTKNMSTEANTIHDEHITQVIYGRQVRGDGTAVEQQKGHIHATKPSASNQILTIDRFPRPQTRIHRDQLQRNKQKRRLQKQRITSAQQGNKKFVKRRRAQLQTVAGSPRLQQKHQRRQIVQLHNRNRIANRNDNFGAKPLLSSDRVDMVNVAAKSGDNHIYTNARLQHFMNAPRRS